MPEEYEAPELTLIGQADSFVMGSSFTGEDLPWRAAFDFEFEQD